MLEVRKDHSVPEPLVADLQDRKSVPVEKKQQDLDAGA
jgi:hypothetical protein